MAIPYEKLLEREKKLRNQKIVHVVVTNETPLLAITIVEMLRKQGIGTKIVGKSDTVRLFAVQNSPTDPGAVFATDAYTENLPRGGKKGNRWVVHTGKLNTATKINKKAEEIAAWALA
ncbi:MAG: hypothetical protein ACOZAO_03770 [Patescibacteria group bacterium]